MREVGIIVVGIGVSLEVHVFEGDRRSVRFMASWPLHGFMENDGAFFGRSRTPRNPTQNISSIEGRDHEKTQIHEEHVVANILGLRPFFPECVAKCSRLTLGVWG